jgi:hypothetical protein
MTAALLTSGLLMAVSAPLLAADAVTAEGAAVAPSHPESDWTPRSFAQPAFKPDFAAMAATIAAEPPPALQQTVPVNKVSQPAAAPAPAAPAAAAQPKLRLEPSWPKTLPEAKAEAAAKNGGSPDGATHGDPADAYTPQEIADAKAHCAAILKGVDAVAVPEDPIRQGNCGTAAPFQLISIGRNPQVTVTPPAIVTCEMVASLATWLKNDLQPAAKRYLGGNITKIETMSSYSCRNAYGRKRTNLSEHGRANALDIRAFVTGTQTESDVLAHWGPTARDIRAQVAAAKAAADKAAAERALAAAKPSSGKGAPGAAPSSATQEGPTVAGTVGTMIGSVPNLAAKLPGVKTPDTGLGLSQPNRLGGPKANDQAAAKSGPAAGSVTAPNPPSANPANLAGRTQFLREAHTSACKIFGTVLGPESNDAHKNHFHVDMAERANGSHFCE